MCQRISQAFDVEVLSYILKSRFYTIVKRFASVRARYKILPSDLGVVPTEGASLDEPYSTYYTRVRVINNGGTTSGGSSVLRSLFPTPFYVDYDAVSSFQPPATPRVPHSTRTAFLPSAPPPLPFNLSGTSSPNSILLLSFRGTYTQSTRPTQSMLAGHRT